MRILLVEDEQYLADAIAHILKRNGFEVDIAADGEVGLAYALKDGDTGSRRAVKIMLGLENGAKTNLQVGGRKISYDRIEIAGRLRDKFFHGSPFREEDLIEEARPVFFLIEHHPQMIADTLLADCELALARWANGASPARTAAITRRKKIPLE